MDLAELLGVLGDGERSPLAQARMDLDRLRPWLSCSWVDEAVKTRVCALAERCGETVELPASVPLGVGEAWLLLALARGRGHVTRMGALPHRTKETAIAPHETFAALRGFAAAAARHQRFIRRDHLETRFGLLDFGTPLRVEGSSLGLSACVALASSITGRAPKSDVAGTASVDPNTGTLLPVAQLDQKCAALQRQWPQVKTLVISEREQVEPIGFRCVRAASVLDALPMFGLPVEALPLPSIDELEERAHRYEREDRQLHEWAAWTALSVEACEVASLVEPHSSATAARARLWAALFASHAGDNVGAARILAAVPDEEVELPSHRAMKATVLASVKIDDDPSLAKRLAADAVALAERLDSTDRKAWLGKALGTHGRAVMHGGEPDAALPLLRRAHEHHVGGDQEARSACYLACCLRLAGRATEALEVASDARAKATTARHWEAAQATIPFATLEQGRALVALGKHEEAAEVLQVLIGHGSPEKYPRLGAHRTLAAAARGSGRNVEAADHLAACTRVARNAGLGLTARKLGVVAMAEDVADAAQRGRGAACDADELEKLWTECFGQASREHVLRTWVY